MTREQATDLVEDLLQASHDYEMLGGRSYREHLAEMKERVINALTDHTLQLTSPTQGPVT